MFEIINEMLLKLVESNTKWMTPSSKLALIGGIMINCDGEGTDMFIPQTFEVRKHDGSKLDLFDQTFG